MQAFREGRPGRWRARLRTPDPVRVVDLLQSAKTALAGVLAWVVAVDVLGLEQPFLAPWAAVLVVHTTIFRTLSRGGQQIAGTFAGVFLGWGSVQVLGPGPLGMGLMLVVALLLGRHHWLREEVTTIATTGIVVLATHEVGESLLTSRLVDTTVGILVGLLVNLLVWPPLRDRAVWTRVEELPSDLADVLGAMATGLGPELTSAEVEQWVTDLRRVDERIDEAWSLLWQARESARLNPRRSRPEGLDDLRGTLHLLEQAVADTLSMARTLATSAEDESRWEEGFRGGWKLLLRDTADAVHASDTARLSGVRTELGELAAELSTEALPGTAWHEYGGLLVNLRNVVDALIQVTEWSARSGPSTRRTKRYPVSEKLPGLRRGAAGAGGGRRLRRRLRGYSGRDEHSAS